MISLDERSDEFKKIKDEWYEEVKTINTKNKLNKFVDKIMKGYELRLKSATTKLRSDEKKRLAELEERYKV